MNRTVDIDLSIDEDGDTSVEISSDLPFEADDELVSVIAEWWAKRGPFFIDAGMIRQDTDDSRDDELTHQMREDGA